MEKYYVNKTGDHEVHDQDCSYLPDSENRKYLGEFSSCEGAVKEAQKTYPTADGCGHCSSDCHKN